VRKCASSNGLSDSPNGFALHIASRNSRNKSENLSVIILLVSAPRKAEVPTRQENLSPDELRIKVTDADRNHRWERYFKLLGDWLGNWFFVRLFIAMVIWRGIVGGFMAAFAELAKTNDFVVEYRYWVVVGIILTGAVIAVLFLVFSRPKPVPKQDKSTNVH
jgi:hypothetical protein